MAAFPFPILSHTDSSNKTSRDFVPQFAHTASAVLQQQQQRIMCGTVQSDNASRWDQVSLLVAFCPSWLSAYDYFVEKTSVKRWLLQGILFAAPSPSIVSARRADPLQSV